MRGPRRPRPCLNCGRMNTNEQPWCSAECCRDYRARGNKPGPQLYEHNDWSKYTGTRDKVYHDIMLHNGRIHYGVWPNSDGWNGWWKDSEVQKVRKSIEHPTQYHDPVSLEPTS